MGVFVACVPSSLARRTLFFSCSPSSSPFTPASQATLATIPGIYVDLSSRKIPCQYNTDHRTSTRKCSNNLEPKNLRQSNKFLQFAVQVNCSNVTENSFDPLRSKHFRIPSTKIPALERRHRNKSLAIFFRAVSTNSHVQP